MGNEIQLVSDGDGLAVIGAAEDVDRFLASQELDQVPSKSLALGRLGRVVGSGTTVAQAAAEISAASGRWVQLTEKSVQQLR
ncbi:MAG: hypothetical protein LBV06_10630 [Propionibacteriaceae bacterium]|jgi:hypothetical protein|nr:hypothetical protein [Propionibacteriaceae bacterium]